MSMTREEAIKAFEEIRENAQNNLGAKWAYGCDGYYRDKIELADVALTALRPVSRERMEKVWPGCHECSGCKLCIWNETKKCNDCKNRNSFRPLSNFCPRCGKALTDAAVQMVMERLEALKDGKDD